MSNMISPTDEQQKIIDCKENIVVLACPGSGKTTTLSFKIAQIMDGAKEWRGVIAISYTNKASYELENRTRLFSSSVNNCFFGTIDKFYLSQIIIPFGKILYGVKTIVIDEIQILHKADLENVDELEKLVENKKIEIIIDYFKGGTIILEYIGTLASNILQNSNDCRRYLKSRFSHVCIDEYQDCNTEKHALFLELVKIGLIGIAVGDSDQAIFGFAGGDSSLLLSLAGNSNFTLLELTKNRRCHQEIVEYSLNFLRPKLQLIAPIEKRVYLRNVTGNTAEIARWIDKNVKQIMRWYKIEKYSDIGILVQSNKTGQMIHEEVTLPTKFFCSTPLDESSLTSDIIFKHIIMYIFGHENEFIERIVEENFLTIEKKVEEKFISYIKTVKRTYLDGKFVDFEKVLEEFSKLYHINIKKDNIESVIHSPVFLDTFSPIRENEMSVLTVHKAKGLEYKIVFILEMYKYILPRHDFINKCFASIDNDKNVHYVAITRAKEAVFFLLGTERTNQSGETKTATLSEFLDANDPTFGFLAKLRNDK